MVRGPTRIWSLQGILQAYENAKEPVKSRVESVLQLTTALGRYTSIATEGPAFGVLTRDLARVFSVREHRVVERRGKTSYYPRKVAGGSAAEDRAYFDSALSAIGLPFPPANESPGHVELGYLDDLEDG